MPVSPHIFRAYDIRGIYGQDLTEESAFLIGRAFGSYLGGGKKVVVGHDARLHSESLKKSFVDGLCQTGCIVTSVGLAPSPLLYFSAISGNFDAGCAITASHNPAEYNGFKLVGEHGHSICGEEIQKIYRIIKEENYLPTASGSVQEDSFLETYQQKLQNMFTFKHPLKVVTDSGNGVTGAFFPVILEKLGLEVIPLLAELDGRFPIHEPDPIVEENTTLVKQAIKEHQADIGICFDGDGDRFSIIDEQGNFYTADMTGLLLARDLLSRHPGAKVVLTVSISESVFEDIRNHGGEALMCPVGHSFVEQTLQEEGAFLGIEQSGHIFIKENYYGYDDALVGALRIIDIVAKSKKKASELYQNLPRSYIHPEIRPFCPDEQKFEIMKQIKAHFEKEYPCITIDGVRIDFGEKAWAGIRVSNTSPRLSICIDAPTLEKQSEIKKIILNHLQNYPEIDWNK